MAKMRTVVLSWRLGAIAAWGMLGSAALAAPVPPETIPLPQAGVPAGLAVVVGTTDGAMEAELTHGGRVLVQGLALSDETAARARRHLFETMRYGLASVSVAKTATTLPYYDRIVNLLVADLDALGKDAPSPAEIERVLGYEGVACLKKGGRWARTVKPTPKEADSWGHARYRASRNGASKDLIVGPPNAARWIGGLAGRMCLEGPRTSDGVFVQYAPMTAGETAPWGEGHPYLWARDVNSGVLLWKRKITTVGPASQSHTSVCMGDLLVAAGGRVYTYNLADDAGTVPAMTAFNIRTGEIEKVFDKSVVFQKTVDPKSHRVSWPRELPMILRLSTVAVEDGKVIQLCDRKLHVMDARSAEVLWKRDPPEGTQYRHVVAGDGLLIALRSTKEDEGAGTFFKPVALECYRLADGNPAWTFMEFDPDLGIMTDLYGLDNGYLPLAGARRKEGAAFDCSAYTVAMLDARKGTLLWKKPIKLIQGQRQFHGRIVGGGFYYSIFGWSIGVLDLASGEQKERFHCGRNRGCSGNAATPLYHIMQKMFHPIQGTGQQTGDHVYYALRCFNPTCGECVAPSYGSIFSLLNACNCEGWLAGGPQAFYAVAPVRALPDAERLERTAGGKALGALPRQTAQQNAPAAEEWRNPKNLSFLIRRFCPEGVKSGGRRPGPGQVWGGYRLERTPPVQAEGLSLVAYVHEHRLAAERSGQEVWNFVAGGRISAEPVVYENVAFFGSHDGYVYAVNVKDGSLAWRFLAAPADKRHVAFGQIESAWPVFNVVLHEGRLYFAAGRHQELDGGIHVYSLDPKTGAAHWHVKSIRGLSTEKHTPPNLGGKGTSSANTYVLNDRIAVRDGKVLLRAGNPVPYAEVALVEDIQNPKDMIVNPETLVPPWRGPAK